MVTIDQKDLKILYYLKNNARISLTELGKLVKLSPAGVTLRINKLVEKGIIEKFTVRLNHDVLTPNSMRYMFQASTQSGTTNEILKELQNTSFFDKLFIVGSELNLYGITYPLFQKDLKKLFKIVETLSIKKFSFIPVLDTYEGSSEFDLTAENISSLYCAHCQKSLSGDAVVTMIGSQILSFCCRDCKENFMRAFLRKYF